MAELKHIERQVGDERSDQLAVLLLELPSHTPNKRVETHLVPPDCIIADL